MKHIFYTLLLCFILVSCQKEHFGIALSKAEAVYNGRTDFGYTFETRLDFYTKDKQDIMVIIWGREQELKDGVYTVCPNIETGGGYDFPTVYGKYVDSTFMCRWDGTLVTGGTVTVKKEDKKYTFILDMVGGGKSLQGEYSGKLSVTDKSGTNPVKGLFASAYLSCQDETSPYYDCKRFLLMSTGNGISPQTYPQYADLAYQRYICWYFPFPDDPVGTYDLTDPRFCQVMIWRDNILLYDPIADSKVVSGTLTIERVNRQSRYKICVDYIDDRGEHLAGCFDGGYYNFDGYSGLGY